MKLNKSRFEISNTMPHCDQEPQLGDHTSSLDLSTEENLKALKTIGNDLLAKPVSSVNIETGYYEPTPEQDWKTNHDALIRSF